MLCFVLRWMDGWLGGWLDRWKDLWMDEWIYRWMGGSMDGWIYKTFQHFFFTLTGWTQTIWAQMKLPLEFQANLCMLLAISNRLSAVTALDFV